MMHNVVIYPQGRDGEEKGNTHRRPARLIDIDVSRITAARVRASSRSFLGTRIEPFREQALSKYEYPLIRRPSAGCLARRGGLAILSRWTGPNSLHILNAAASRENESARARIIKPARRLLHLGLIRKPRPPGEGHRCDPSSRLSSKRNFFARLSRFSFSSSQFFFSFILRFLFTFLRYNCYLDYLRYPPDGLDGFLLLH